jgi:hypothetical protein
MIALLGLFVLYSWVHTAIICYKKLNVTGYQKFIVIFGFIAMALYVIGTLA